MRVAIVHDDLVQWGGAERVLLGLCETFPDAQIFTSVFDRKNKELVKKFESKKIVTSFLQKIPGWKKLYKILLPLYPIAFEQFNFDEFDLVISHTTRFAKCIVTKPQTLHICYCHTPPRFLWNFADTKKYSFAEILFSKLRVYDRIWAQRPDYFLAGSKNAQERIKNVYKRNSEVIYPFVDLERFENTEIFDGGYYVTISRLNDYKKVDLVIGACLELRVPLKIIGSGEEFNKLKSLDEGGLVEFLGNIDDNLLALTLSGAKALIVAGVEDFGLVSLEAQALGKPVLAYNKGGNMETVVNGKSGILFDEQTIEGVKNAIIRLDSMTIDPLFCRENAKKFGKEIFMKNFKSACLLKVN